MWGYGSSRRELPKPFVLRGGGAVVGRTLLAGQRWDVAARLSPMLCSWAGSAELADTGVWNTRQREAASQSSRTVIILQVDQRAELHFLLEASVAASWRPLEHHAFIARAGYTQGFRHFIFERALVFDNSAAAPQGAGFSMRITGTCLRFEVGYGLGIRFCEKISTKYREIPPGGGLPRRSR